MLWLLLATVLILTVLSSFVVGILLHIMTAQRKQFQSQLNQWELERERLLNRAMTLKWQDYAQMTQHLTSAPSISEADGRGMSDEEEMRRMAAVYHETVGVGETILDLSQDFKDLGIDTETLNSEAR